MSLKNNARLRRCKKTRKKIASLTIHRLSVYRSAKNIYAQIISEDNRKVITSVSSIDKSLRDKNINGSNVAGAVEVGRMIAEKAVGLGIQKVAFDSSGYKYHGRVKALADAAREHGLKF